MRAATLLYMTFQDDILREVTDHYLNSGDFNGLFALKLTGDQEQLKSALSQMIREDRISLTFGDIHPNPHIKAFEAEPASKQLEKIDTLGLQSVCIYPTKAHLATVVDQSQYHGLPFTQKLAMGEPQLGFYSFNLSVLEIYRNDPRYYYRNDDVSGTISIASNHPESGEMQKSDQVLLQTFGFSYDSNMNRAVAVFLRYLADLSPEHQQIWNAKVLGPDYKLHPDYYKSSMGHWPEGASLFTAFLYEQYHINEMCRLMGRPPLFRQEFTEGRRPRGFGFLVRPTLKEFNDFVLLLDKMLSDNIDVQFFQGEVPLEEEVPRDDGRVVIRHKGSLAVLEEWVRAKFRPSDPEPIDEMFAALRDTRKQRQHPAHAVEEDRFDQKYFQEHRELAMRAYDAIRTLRLMFKNHPACHAHSIPDWLQTGKIWTY